MITSEKLQIINDYHHLSTIPEPMSQVFIWIPGSWAGLTLYYLKQTFLIINQHNHAWSMVAPAPEYQVEIISSGSRRETLNAHACVTRRDQAISQALRCRDITRQHVLFPVQANCVVCLYSLRLSLRRIQRIENRFGIDFVGTQRNRLQRPPQQAGLSYGCDG